MTTTSLLTRCWPSAQPPLPSLIPALHPSCVWPFSYRPRWASGPAWLSLFRGLGGLGVNENMRNAQRNRPGLARGETQAAFSPAGGLARSSSEGHKAEGYRVPPREEGKWAEPGLAFQGADVFFLVTNFLVTPQQVQGRCPEVRLPGAPQHPPSLPLPLGHRPRLPFSFQGMEGSAYTSVFQTPA